jgi:hypothetical protein
MKLVAGSEAQLSEIREAILEGAGIELIPKDEGGWYARIGLLRQAVPGRTAADVLMQLADIVVGPRVQ